VELPNKMKHKAVTFLELILAVSIMLIIFATVVPQMANYMFSNQLEVAGQEVIHVLRKAQAQAATQVHDSAWQVEFDLVAGEYTLGVVGAPTQDLVYSVPEGVDISSATLTGGGDVVIFDQLTGATSTDGSVVLTVSDGSTFTISINIRGHVDES
jgi:type II secretory pathway pseudopilin PulG